MERSNSFYRAAHTSQVPFTGRTRTLSNSSLDPYEDPVVGLERVSQNVRQRNPRTQSTVQPRVADRRRKHDENALSSRFESLDYEITENELYKSEEKNPSHQRTLWRKSRNRWIACFFIGVATAVVGASIDLLVHYNARLKFGYILGPLVAKCGEDASGGCMWMVQAAWMTYNSILVGLAACLVMWAPIAGGSGIPQIKCFLNGIHVPEVVKLKTLVAKALGVSCAVGGGLSAGKEGPMIHSGAVIGAGVSQGQIKSCGVDLGFFKEFRNDREQRDFVSAGAAAGVAAAFGAPIGGVLFSLEEGASFWNQSLTWRMFFSAMISSFTLSTILSFFYGQSGALSWTGLANFGVFQKKEYNLWEIPFFLAMGVIGGCLGASFNFINIRIAEFRKKYMKNNWQGLLEAILVAAVSAFTAFITILAVDDCVPVGVNTNKTDVIQLYCKKGEYSAVANLFFQNPEESVKSLFHSPMNSFRASTLAIFSVEYFILTVWTFGLAVPSGVFIPCILTGAAWGRLSGLFIEYLFPNITGIDPGKYALMGAAAQLGGVVRMTISLAAILMEATKDITFGLPIMLVLMTAKWVGDLFGEGLYDACIELSEVPILGWNPPKMARNILASKVMRKDVVALEERERVGRVLQVLRETVHHGFPLVDRIDESLDSTLPDYGRLKGIILRSHLLALLRQKAFIRDGEDEILGSPISLPDFAEDQSGSVDNCGVTREEESCWLDFTPYMHPHPHRVPLNASLPSIHRIFRGLGLRYLMVVNEDNRLRGVITRKDVARYREARKNNHYTVHELYIADTTEDA